MDLQLIALKKEKLENLRLEINEQIQSLNENKNSSTGNTWQKV